MTTAPSGPPPTPTPPAEPVRPDEPDNPDVPAEPDADGDQTVGQAANAETSLGQPSS
jgi:hypothetical protein